MNPTLELIGAEKHYESQTDAIIRLIREKTPEGGATLPEIMSLTVNGMRIAGRTARITDARKRLRKLGENIVCLEDPPLRQGGKRIRRTRYIIMDLETKQKTDFSVFDLQMAGQDGIEPPVSNLRTLENSDSYER